MSKSANISFFINGNKINAPIEWLDISILSTFETDQIQANITIDSFNFALEARSEILSHISDGRIFEGLPFQIVAKGSNNELTIFDGLIDLTEDFENLVDAGKVSCKLEKRNGLNQLDKRLSALNYDYLESLGEIGEVDYVSVPYVIEKENNALDIALLVFLVAYVTDTVIQQIASTANAIAVAVGIASSSITGIAGSTIFKVANAIIELAKLGALIVVFADLGRRVLDLFISPKREHKAILLKTLLEKAFAHLGYALETDLLDLENIVYLPSNNGIDERSAFGKIIGVNTIQKGIPKVNDFGFNCRELVEIATKYFNAKIGIVGDTIQFRKKGSDYWTKKATYNMPDVLQESKKYNTGELVANKLFAFDTDSLDSWTLADFTGTNFEVITSATNPQNEAFLSGLNEVRYNTCLASRKDKINALEIAVSLFAGIIDTIVNLFGGNSNLQQSATSSEGVMRVSQNNHSKPKLLWLEGGQVATQRDKISAKISYENYHSYDSFVLDNYNGQKQIFRGRVGFGLDDFVKLSENSYFYTNDNKLAQAIKIEWAIGLDYAVIDYFVREPYTERLTETTIEP